MLFINLCNTPYALISRKMNAQNISEGEQVGGNIFDACNSKKRTVFGFRRVHVVSRRHIMAAKLLFLGSRLVS